MESILEQLNEGVVVVDDQLRVEQNFDKSRAFLIERDSGFAYLESSRELVSGNYVVREILRARKHDSTAELQTGILP